jgi:hypothetical protein
LVRLTVISTCSMFGWDPIIGAAARLRLRTRSEARVCGACEQGLQKVVCPRSECAP